MNTASRMDHALPSYELLMTDSAARAGELTTWLEQKNTERQQITAKATTVAREQVLARKLEPLIHGPGGRFFIGYFRAGGE